MKEFNKEDMGMFFGQYRKLLVNGGFVHTRIWNCDETWFTTVVSEDDDEWPCLVCGEPFRSSRSGESLTRFNKICHPSQRPRWQVDKEAIGLSRVQQCSSTYSPPS